MAATHASFPFTIPLHPQLIEIDIVNMDYCDYGTAGYGPARFHPDANLKEPSAPFGLSAKLPFVHHGAGKSMLRSTRKRLNALAIFLSILIPWLLFCVVFMLVSFQSHYYHPAETYVIVAVLFFLTVPGFAFMSYLTKLRKEKENHDDHEPMWYGFITLTCLLAMVVAVILGWNNFTMRMQWLYDLQNLATFHDIDPANYVGQQLVDAGLVQFSADTHLDVKKSMGFKNIDMYCAAPIVSNHTGPRSFHDFWAVGKNCCSGRMADFNCKDAQRIGNMGGFRLMEDAERPFYRLAVQQAEAMYGIFTRKPLFFIWTEDPIGLVKETEHNAHLMYLFGILGALIVQIFLVVSATLVFAKVFPQR